MLAWSIYFVTFAKGRRGFLLSSTPSEAHCHGRELVIDGDYWYIHKLQLVAGRINSSSNRGRRQRYYVGRLRCSGCKLKSCSAYLLPPLSLLRSKCEDV